MEHFFNCISEPSYICKIYVNVPYNSDIVEKQIITINKYKVIIQLKTTNEKFIVFYGVYKYKEFNYSTKNILADTERSYKIILNIIAEDNYISNEGLYDCYIATGIYAYKIFDYMSYGTMNIARDKKYRISDTYAFIGDLMTNMWPLPTLVEPAPPA